MIMPRSADGAGIKSAGFDPGVLSVFAHFNHKCCRFFFYLQVEEEFLNIDFFGCSERIREKDP